MLVFNKTATGMQVLEYDPDNVYDHVTLIVDQLEIVASRSLLAARSPFFREKFNAPASPSVDRLTLHGISAAVMPDIVDFVHSGYLHVRAENAQALSEAANLLHLQQLRDIVDDYFVETTTKKSTTMTKTAKSDGSKSKSQQAEAEAEPPKMDASSQQKRPSDANVSSNIFDRLQRANVLKCAEEMLALKIDGPTVFSALITTIGLMMMISHGLQATANAPQVLMVISSREAHSYDFEENRWTALGRDASDDYAFHAAIELDRRVYIFGRPKRDVVVYDPATATWTQRNGLRSYCAEAGVAVLNGCIYLVGGRDLWNSDKHLNDVHMFHARTGDWQATASMLRQRSAVGVAVLNGWLYAVGGFDGRTSLASAERYDADTNRWSAIADMNQTRSYVGVCAMGGRLYAVGGEHAANMLPSRSAEVYDPMEDVWRPLPPMALRRSKPSVVTYNGELYVMGGTIDRTVEVYSPKTNKWRRLAESMPQIVGDSVAYVIDRPGGWQNRRRRI